ncbi:MAG: hypothetical protein ACREQN_03620 [Candidatus Binataceae bacterium]
MDSLVAAAEGRCRPRSMVACHMHYHSEAHLLAADLFRGKRLVPLNLLGYVQTEAPRFAHCSAPQPRGGRTGIPKPGGVGCAVGVAGCARAEPGKVNNVIKKSSEKHSELMMVADDRFLALLAA